MEEQFERLPVHRSQGQVSAVIEVPTFFRAEQYLGTLSGLAVSPFLTLVFSEKGFDSTDLSAGGKLGALCKQWRDRFLGVRLFNRWRGANVPQSFISPRLRFERRAVRPELILQGDFSVEDSIVLGKLNDIIATLPCEFPKFRGLRSVSTTIHVGSKLTKFPPRPTEYIDWEASIGSGVQVSIEMKGRIAGSLDVSRSLIVDSEFGFAVAEGYELCERLGFEPTYKDACHFYETNQMTIAAGYFLSLINHAFNAGKPKLINRCTFILPALYGSTLTEDDKQVIIAPSVSPWIWRSIGLSSDFGKQILTEFNLPEMNLEMLKAWAEEQRKHGR